MGLFKRKKELPADTGDGETISVAVVFVHGLGGSRETWRAMSELLRNEWKYKNGFKFYYLHYYLDGFLIKYLGWFDWMKSILRVLNSASLESLAVGLDSYIEVNCREFDKILLVSHSMGGLISKKYIVNSLEKSHQTKVHKYITYATPHSGSIWAEFGFKKQIRQMKVYNSDFLTRLNEDWASFRAYEKVKPTYVVGDVDWIVKDWSASGTDPESSIVWASGHDHFSVINPKSTDHVGYRQLYNTLEDLLIEFEDGIEDNYEDEFDTGLVSSSFEEDFDEIDSEEDI
jgi:pimeloyl-ACP methyl ester carboxylesterase